MIRAYRLLALVVLAAPSVAAAQVVYVQAPAMPPMPPMPPPPPPGPPPMIYATPGAMPPHVYIRERIRWWLRRRPRVIYVQAPPPVVVQVPQYQEPPIMPLPAVPPPVIVPPPCCCAPQLAAPEVVVEPARPPGPQWTSRLGLGVRGTGAVEHDGWNNLGIGGELLYRATPHLTTELAAEYDHSAANALGRTDVPVTFGLRMHIGRPDWVVSPYFVVAAGADFASQDLKFTHDDAIYLDGQIGGGLELRLGQHVAITADARLDAKKRANGVAENVAATTSIDGKPVHALGDEVGGQFRLGVAVYF